MKTSSNKSINTHYRGRTFDLILLTLILLSTYHHLCVHIDLIIGESYSDEHPLHVGDQPKTCLNTQPSSRNSPN